MLLQEQQGGLELYPKARELRRNQQRSKIRCMVDLLNYLVVKLKITRLTSRRTASLIKSFQKDKPDQHKLKT